MGKLRLARPRTHDECGRVITVLRKARFLADPGGMGDFWYYDCECGSTLVARPDEVIEEPEQESKAA
jgi:hypothetical protein